MRKMKKLRKKARRKAKPYPSYLEAVAIVLILVIVGMAALSVPPAPVKIPITTETLSAACLSGERGEMDIRAVGNSIIVIAPIETPNPCYSVSAEATIENGNIKVEMTTRASAEICIQCIGAVTGKVMVPNLAPGLYGLDVRTPSSAATTTITVGG